MKKINYFSVIIIFSIIFLFILCKIILIPITHDEMATPTAYINYSFWQIMMYPDEWPNNHILNTLLVKVFTFLFGKDQIVVRMPNLLSFVLYAIAIFRINKTVLKVDSLFFIPATLLFVANPYLLDFFGLCRGYGLSCALITLSVSYLITGFFYSKNKDLWISLILAILASYANFTLLDCWVSITLIVDFYFFLKSGKQLRQLIKPTLIIVLITIMYLALIANPIYKMQSTNQFKYWTSKGFFSETIMPLIDFSRYDSHMFFYPSSKLIAAFIFCIIGTNLIYIFFRLRKDEYKLSSLYRPVFLATSVLLLTAFINIMQCKLLNTPNLIARTALFFYPLFVITFVCTLGLISLLKTKILKICIAFAIFFCVCISFDRQIQFQICKRMVV